MTADFNLDLPAGGSSHSPGGGSHTKKGFKINKPMLYIGGAVIIILFLVISRSRNQSSGQAIDTPPDSPIGYPTNSADVAGQLQNNADIVTGQVQAQLNGFQAHMDSEYGTQLTAIQNKLSAMQPISDGADSHPHPTQTTPHPTPKPAPHPAPAPKPAVSHKPAPAPTPYTIKKGDTLTALAKKNHTTVQAIAKANNIKDPNKIKAGATLKFPAPAPAHKKK